MNYYIANNLHEAETIVNLLQGHPDVSAGWTDWKFLGGYPLYIKVTKGFHCPQCESVEYEDGELSTIAELLTLALTGWKESKWKPDYTEDYYVPSLNSESLHYCDINTGKLQDDLCFNRGLYCRTSGEARARTVHMLEANEEFVWDEDELES